MVEKSKFMLKW